MAPFAQPIPADNLRDALSIRELTPSVVADESGLSAPTVSRALRGRPVTVETRRRILDVLARHPVKKDVAKLQAAAPVLHVVDGEGA